MVIAGVALLGFAGSMWWVLDLTASFRPQQAFVLVLLGAAAYPARRRTAAGILLVGVLVAALLVPDLFGSPRAIASGSTGIEILEFNVGVSNPHRDEIAAFIQEEDPDVVFLFESTFEWEDALRARNLDIQMISIVPRGDLAGVTVLARPDLLPGAVEVSLDGEAAAIAVTIDGQRVELLGVHPPSPTTARRAGRRDALLAAAGEWVASRPGEVVVVGDLNSTPWSHAFRTLRDEGTLTDTRTGAGIQASWPEGFGVLRIPIDHVLVTSGLGFADRRTGPAFGSDHRPVMVTIGPAG